MTGPSLNHASAAKRQKAARQRRDLVRSLRPPVMFSFIHQACPECGQHRGTRIHKAHMRARLRLVG
jgi:hypothetical protein